MPSSVSALHGATAQGFVTIRDAGLRGMVSIRADLSDADLVAALAHHTGNALPSQRQIVFDGDECMGWMSPDELLWMMPYEKGARNAAALMEALTGAHALVVDMSDARAILRLEGRGVRDVIAKLCPVDMHTSAFGPGELRRTRLAQIPCALWMPDETSVEVVCFRSVARYAFDALSLAAHPGSEIGMG